MAGGAGPKMQVGSDWSELVALASGRTVLLVGPTGAGKSTFAEFLASSLAARGESVARVTADPGQPAFGLPTCIALALGPRASAESMWFVGSTSPVGHLLPTTLGVARLVERARQRRATSIIVDSSGLVSGQAARVLAAHTCFAARADLAVALGQSADVSHLAGLLARCGARVMRTRSPGARERTAAERRDRRQALFARYFADSARHEIDPARIVGADWLPLSESARPFVVTGTAAGLIDAAGFCRGLGVVVAERPGRAFVDTPVADAGAAERVQIARLRLEPGAGYAEATPARPL